MHTSPAILTARKVYETALLLLSDEQGVHAETVCSLLGVTMGMALFKKHHPTPIRPEDAGQAAPSPIVDQDMPNILAALDKLARDSGMRFSVAQAATSVPPAHAPQVAPLDLLKTHGGTLWQILSTELQGPEERLLATLFAVLFIVRQTQPIFTTDVASALIVEGFVTGAKFSPPS